MLTERICALLLGCAFGCALFAVTSIGVKVITTETQCQPTGQTRQVDVWMTVAGVMVPVPIEERQFACPKGEVWR